MKRIKQVLKYGWLHAGQICDSQSFGTLLRIRIFMDILYCYRHYKMWSNQYLKEDFFNKSNEERKRIGSTYLEQGTKRDEWQKDFRDNRKFLIKYSNIRYEKASLREKRNEAYRKRFGAGKGLMVEYNVNISRQHYLNGSISIGKNVLFAKNVFVDYSGDVIIQDDVKFSHGAILESHTHPHFTDPSIPPSIAIPCKIIIERGVNIGSGSIILDSCSRIGRYSRIAAGAVVRNPVPPYSIVIGNPGKVVGFVFTPEEVEEFEKDKYDVEQKTPIEKYRKTYEKQYIDKMSYIKNYLSNY